MIAITTALVAEHAMYCALFDHIEQLLPKLDRPAEVKRLARLVEGLLRGHAAAEEDLVLVALDHDSEHKRRANRLHQEHKEIDGRLTRVHGTNNVAQARGLLRAAIVASRSHFKHEERVVFPLIERVTKPETLTRLGATWMQRRHMPANWTI
jgi:iron-sulfur cluster repair protein YtfE (RIC family)